MLLLILLALAINGNITQAIMTINNFELWNFIEQFLPIELTLPNSIACNLQLFQVSQLPQYRHLLYTSQPILINHQMRYMTTSQEVK